MIEFSDAFDTPLNEWIRDAWIIAGNTGDVSKEFVEQIRFIYTQAFDEGQGFVWKMRQAVPRKDGTLAVPGDKDYNDLIDLSGTMTITNGKGEIKTIELDKKGHVIENDPATRTE